MPSVKSHPIRWAVVLAAMDGACIFSAFALTSFLTRAPGETLPQAMRSHADYFAVLFTVWCIQAVDQRLFVSRRGDALIPQIFAFTKAVFLSLVLTIFVLALMHREALDRQFALTFSGFVLVSMVLFRTTMRLGIWGLRHRGYSYRRILMIGSNERSAEIAEIILAQRHYGFQIMGFLDDDPARARTLERYMLPYLGDVDTLERVLVDKVVDVVYISLPIRSYHEKIQSIAHLCEGVGVPVRLVADLFPLKMASSALSKVADVPVLTLTTEPEVQPQLALKRATDLLVSSILILMLSPLFALIAVAIKLESSGPVFTMEERLSRRDNRAFKLMRFRTRGGASNGVWDASDSAIDVRRPNGFTKVGTFLYRYGLDELPELFNIWRGQLSLAEPRPQLIASDDTADLRALRTPLS